MDIVQQHTLNSAQNVSLPFSVSPHLTSDDMLETRSHSSEHTHTQTHTCVRAYSQSTEEGTGAGGGTGVCPSSGWVFITCVSWGLSPLNSHENAGNRRGNECVVECVWRRNWDKQKLQTTWRPPCTYDILHSSALQRSPPIQRGLCYHSLDAQSELQETKSHMIWLMFFVSAVSACELHTHGSTAPSILELFFFLCNLKVLHFTK